MLVTDGGGRRKAALRPLAGPAKVARFLAAVTPPGVRIATAWTQANGPPALLFYLDEVLDALTTLVVRGGRVTELYFVRNPDTLHHLAEPRDLTRR